MTYVDRSDNYCVIGAGPSGLAVLKNFRQHAIAVDGLEREDDVGGTWYFGRPASSIYRSTHLISSKKLTEFTDFPMPEEYPYYPGHQQALQYLRAYARHFHLYELVQFRTTVTRIEPVGEYWTVTLATGATRRYRGVVICNGHHWDPNRPSYPGHFSGLALHSAEYKTPDILAGRRVLVIGAGNSGCDIAVEAAQCAERTFHSMRRGYHYLPKFLLGKPVDECGERLLRWGLPLWLRRLITARFTKISLGRPEDIGLPKPDHKLFESHPIVNSQMFYYVGHGRIVPKPQVVELCGDEVAFSDGSREKIDVMIYATGYRLSFPFIDHKHLNWHAGRPLLYLNVFHPEYDNLFVAGMIQADSGLWGLVDYQAQLIAGFIRSLKSNPQQATRFRRRKAIRRENLGHGIHYVNSPRHLLEVEHYSYRRRLQKLISQFD